MRTSAFARLGAGLVLYGVLVLVLRGVYPGGSPPALVVIVLGAVFALSCLAYGHPLRIAPWHSSERSGARYSRFASLFGIAATTYLLWDAFASIAQYPSPHKVSDEGIGGTVPLEHRAACQTRTSPARGIAVLHHSFDSTDSRAPRANEDT